MSSNDVQDVGAQVESRVTSRPQKVEGEVDGRKRGLKGLSDGVNERLGKFQQHALDSTKDSARTGRADRLKRWTETARATIIYDSMVDEFTDDGLFQKVKGRENIALVATTNDGDEFGGFYSVAVTEQSKDFFDPNIFVFSFESHGRCETPQRFPVKERLRHRASLKYYHCHSRGWFLWVGVDKFGSFQIGNEESATWCFYPSLAFEGMERTTLTGSTWESQEKQNCHRCSRIIALQMV